MGMDILDSLEVRWFLASGDPALLALDAWFAADTPESDRTDHYLVTERNDLGFKARLVAGQPARVETKFLVGSLGPVQLGPDAIGVLERWRKVSFVTDDADLEKEGAWLPVTKSRRLKKIAHDGGQTTAAELTQLEYTWRGERTVEWTFGVEAVGPAPELLAILLAAWQSTGEGLAGVSLRSEGSLSYASWLRTRTSTAHGAGSR